MNPQIQRQDSDNLKSLATAFRVIGILYGAGLIIAGLAFATFAIYMVRQMPGTSPHEGSLMQSSSGIALGFVLFIIGAVCTLAAFFTASSIDQRKNFNLCVAASAFCILFQPIGLILGVLSLVVLLRPSVQQAFHS